jgi:hypothetical protein
MSNVNLGNSSSFIDDRNNASDLSLEVPSNSSISYGDDGIANNSLQFPNFSSNLFSDGDVIVDVSDFLILLTFFSKGVYLRAAWTT